MLLLLSLSQFLLLSTQVALIVCFSSQIELKPCFDHLWDLLDFLSLQFHQVISF